MSNHLDRRGFSKLAAAAFGGMVAGSATAPAQEAEKKPVVPVDPALLLKEPHVCRGLNTCKAKGKGGENACAGQGACASIKHACAGENECKGQGGCGGYPGQNNTCKGKGSCAVPLDKETWEVARMQFRELMEANGKKLGKAPGGK